MITDREAGASSARKAPDAFRICGVFSQASEGLHSKPSAYAVRLL